MAAPPSSRLQNMLQAAVQSVQWTYSLFWQFCPRQGILVWGDGYYNGIIKTRKTVQPMEFSAEEATLQRSQQLRELYESLSAGEINQPTRRPSVALSPEDLTESEWFYLMCVSFNFPPGTGLPGKAYARGQHVWLAGANEADSKTFSRAILAKSARVQTVVCIPLLDGVVEIGNSDKVEEDLGFIQHVKGFFTERSHQCSLRPKPALSEHSTSNPATSSDHLHFQSASAPVMYSASTEDTPIDTNLLEDEADEEEEEKDEQGSDLEDEEGGLNQIQAETSQDVAVEAEPSELMQVEMSEDIRLGSPDDGSNNLDPLDFHLLGSEDADEHHRRRVGLSESCPTWTMSLDPLSGCLELPSTGSHPPEDFMQEDSHYSQTVSTVLQSQFTRWAEFSTITYTACSNQSAFTKWTIRSDQSFHPPVEATSQWLLKYILFSVPYLLSKYHEENSPRLRDSDASNRYRKGTPQGELSASHVLAERRRREKLNEKFIILRSLVPFVTKMDKASILGDTIEYLKQLRNKIEDLETCSRQMEMERQSRPLDPPSQRTSSREQMSGITVMDQAGVGPRLDMRIAEGRGGGSKPKMTGALSLETSIEVSIIETDALLELQCHHRDGLLLDIMQMLREFRIEITAVQSSLNNGFFVGELRAKVKDNVHGKRVSITEVKRLIRQIIPHE